MKETEQFHCLCWITLLFLLAQGARSSVFAEDAPPVGPQSASPAVQGQKISTEDLEVIRQMRMLQNMDLFKQEDVVFLDQYEETESISNGEVDHAQ